MSAARALSSLQNSGGLRHLQNHVPPAEPSPSPLLSKNAVCAWVQAIVAEVSSYQMELPGTFAPKVSNAGGLECARLISLLS